MYKKKRNLEYLNRGRKLEVNIESDIKLDNGVKFKNEPFETQQ